MPGRIAALYRHPVKGFTPERLPSAELEEGATFPCDRLYAVENGPSGFDPSAPVFLPKQRFTVLMSIPSLARAHTRYNEASGIVSVRADGFPALEARLTEPAGREAFAAWLTAFIPPDDRRGALRLLAAPGAHRFTDDVRGAVSLLNLASVRDLSEKLGRKIDPLRFRCNLHVDGWPAWAEADLPEGTQVQVGAAGLKIVKPIVRCLATHVDPETGERDMETVPSLMSHYGRPTCGVYFSVVEGGRVAEGDPAAVEIPSKAAA